MSSFYNKSLKKVTLKSTTIHECSTLNNFKANGYLNIPSIKNDTISDNFSNTTYKADVPSIEN